MIDSNFDFVKTSKKQCFFMFFVFFPEFSKYDRFLHFFGKKSKNRLNSVKNTKKHTFLCFYHWYIKKKGLFSILQAHFHLVITFFTFWNLVSSVDVFDFFWTKSVIFVKKVCFLCFFPKTVERSCFSLFCVF